jgi:hypothetical protein
MECMRGYETGTMKITITNITLNIFVRFMILLATSIKMAIFRDVLLCSLVDFSFFNIP